MIQLRNGSYDQGFVDGFRAALVKYNEKAKPKRPSGPCKPDLCLCLCSKCIKWPMSHHFNKKSKKISK